MNARLRGQAMVVAAVALVGLATACGGGDAGEEFDDEVAADLDAKVEQWAGEAVAGGLVVRVDAPGGQRTIAAGPADADGDEELAGDEAFQIASVTKMVTTTVALQLGEEGAVDLDAPIAEVVPEPADLIDQGDQITLRQLLGHTSGLPQDLDAGLEDPWAASVEVEDGVATVACGDVEPYIRLRDPIETVFEPGTDFQYASIGYRLAGEVIEAVTGQPLEDVYRERILDPLGMDDTWLDCREEPRADMARGLHPPDVDNPEVLSFPLPGQGDEPFDVTELGRHAWASAGLRSTAEDVAAFGRALFAGDLFDDEATLEAMLEPGPAPFYGLGIELDDGSGGETIGHPGAHPGYNSRLAYDPEHDIVIVALSNQTLNPHRTPLATLAAHAVRDVVVRHEQPD